MSKFEINFFYLEETNNRNEYKEELLNLSLKLSSIEDIKNFFSSDFYNGCAAIAGVGDGVVITENNKVIYKEINEGLFDNKFLIHEIIDAPNIDIFYVEGEEDKPIKDEDLIIVDKYNIAGHGVIL